MIRLDCGGLDVSLRQFSTSDCSGSATKTASKVFYVGRATPYNSSGATTVQNSFRAGATAYVAVAGMPRGMSDFNVYWIGPSGVVVCANTAGADRPDADSEGKLPKGGGGVIQYRPALRDSSGIASPITRSAPAPTSSAQIRIVEAPARPERDEQRDLATFDRQHPAPAAPVLDGTPPLLSTSTTCAFAFSGSEPWTSFSVASTARVTAYCSLAVLRPASIQGGLTDRSHTFVDRGHRHRRKRERSDRVHLDATRVRRR